LVIERKGRRLKMNNTNSGLIVWLVAVVSFISTLSIIPVPAEAAPTQNAFAASIDGGQLPPCPSIFKCIVQ
jgi:hypothetical protein